MLDGCLTTASTGIKTQTMIITVYDEVECTMLHVTCMYAFMVATMY